MTKKTQHILGYIIYCIGHPIQGENTLLELVALAKYRDSIDLGYEIKIEDGYPKCEKISKDLEQRASVQLIKKEVVSVDELWESKTYKYSPIEEFEDQLKNRFEKLLGTRLTQQIKEFLNRFKSEDEIHKEFCRLAEELGRSKRELQNI